MNKRRIIVISLITTVCMIAILKKVEKNLEGGLAEQVDIKREPASLLNILREDPFSEPAWYRRPLAQQQALPNTPEKVKHLLAQIDVYNHPELHDLSLDATLDVARQLEPFGREAISASFAIANMVRYYSLMTDDFEISEKLRELGKIVMTIDPDATFMQYRNFHYYRTGFGQDILRSIKMYGFIIVPREKVAPMLAAAAQGLNSDIRQAAKKVMLKYGISAADAPPTGGPPQKMPVLRKIVDGHWIFKIPIGIGGFNTAGGSVAGPVGSDMDEDGALLLYQSSLGVYRVDLEKETVERVCPDIAPNGAFFAYVPPDILTWGVNHTPETRFDRQTCQTKEDMPTRMGENGGHQNAYDARVGLMITSPNGPAIWDILTQRVDGLVEIPSTIDDMPTQPKIYSYSNGVSIWTPTTQRAKYNTRVSAPFYSEDLTLEWRRQYSIRKSLFSKVTKTWWIGSSYNNSEGHLTRGVQHIFTDRHALMNWLQTRDIPIFNEDGTIADVNKEQFEPSPWSGRMYPLCGKSGPLHIFESPNSDEELEPLTACSAVTAGLDYENVYFFDVLGVRGEWMAIQAKIKRQGFEQPVWIRLADFTTPFQLKVGSTLLPSQYFYPEVLSVDSSLIKTNGQQRICDSAFGREQIPEEIPLPENKIGKLDILDIEVISNINVNRQDSCRT